MQAKKTCRNKMQDNNLILMMQAYIKQPIKEKNSREECFDFVIYQGRIRTSHDELSFDYTVRKFSY